MNCDDFLRLLGPYIDGKLPNHLLEDFEIHLKICNLCLVEYNKLKRYLSKLAEMPPVLTPPQELRNLIIETVSLNSNVETKESLIHNHTKETKKPEKCIKYKDEKNRIFWEQKFIYYFFVSIGLILLILFTVFKILRH